MRSIRVHNASAHGFTDLSVANVAFGSLTSGETSEYRRVSMTFRYAVVKLTADGRSITGQTLNLGAQRFTYRIDIVDLDAGQLAIEVVREE